LEFTEYISGELYVLIPILYILGVVIKNSRISDWKIPLILGAAGIVLAGIWIFANNAINGAQSVLNMIFASITQGMLCAAASVYTNNIYKQIKGKDNGNTKNDDTDTDNTVG